MKTIKRPPPGGVLDWFALLGEIATETNKLRDEARKLAKAVLKDDCPKSKGCGVKHTSFALNPFVSRWEIETPTGHPERRTLVIVLKVEWRAVVECLSSDHAPDATPDIELAWKDFNAVYGALYTEAAKKLEK
jgi:hypothetical protein